MKDYYSLLGIDTSATKADIKKNYRALATKYHPDKNSDPKAAEKFIVITEAYDVLSNPKRRAKYDLFKWQQRQQQKAAAESFTVVPPPRESARTRRNRAQKKRSSLYYSSKSSAQKFFLLTKESFFLSTQYILHILGISILVTILNHEIGLLSRISEIGIIRVIIICAMVAGIVYCIYWIVRNFIQWFKLDIQAFSVFYRITRLRAALIVVVGLVVILAVFATVLLKS